MLVSVNGNEEALVNAHSCGIYLLVWVRYVDSFNDYCGG
jgi:hypothetical protein